MPNYLLQRQPERFRWKAGADDDEEAVIDTEGIWIIDRALGFVFGEPRLFHAADNADDGECFGILARFGAVPQALAEGAGVRPVVSREVFVHNADSLGAARIVGGEETSCAQGETHGAEIVAGDSVRVVSAR